MGETLRIVAGVLYSVERGGRSWRRNPFYWRVTATPVDKRGQPTGADAVIGEGWEELSSDAGAAAELCIRRHIAKRRAERAARRACKPAVPRRSRAHRT